MCNDDKAGGSRTGPKEECADGLGSCPIDAISMGVAAHDVVACLGKTGCQKKPDQFGRAEPSGRGGGGEREFRRECQRDMRNETGGKGVRKNQILKASEYKIATF